MYTGDINQLFGVTVTPRVSFIVNTEFPGFSKTFDILTIAATGMLDTIDFETQGMTSQVVNGTNIESSGRVREGKIVMPTPRAIGEERLRGLRMLTTVKWKNLESVLEAVYTDFRPSARIPG